MGFRFAYKLCHCSHRTVNAPRSGLIENHSKKSQYGRSEHYAIKTEGKLSGAVGEQSAAVGPMPRKFKCPQQGHGSV